MTARRFFCPTPSRDDGSTRIRVVFMNSPRTRLLPLIGLTVPSSLKNSKISRGWNSTESDVLRTGLLYIGHGKSEIKWRI